MIVVKERTKAYSLIELAISMTILAVIGTASAELIGNRVETNRLKHTEQNMQTIKEAIHNFYNLNGFLPCPAPGNLTETDANFGGDPIPANNPYNPTTKVCNNLAGSVPVYALQLPPSYSYDGWDNKFTYRAATGMGAASDMSSIIYKGDLNIINREGKERTQIHAQSPNNLGGAYVLISHGRNGLGAWLRNSTATAPAPTNREAENVDHTNKRYVADSLSPAFDDIVQYGLKSDFLPTKRTNSPSLIPDMVCHDANTILSQGEPATGLNNQLDSFIALDAAYIPIAQQAFVSANLVNHLCNNPPYLSECAPELPSLSGLVLWLDAEIGVLNNADATAANGEDVKTWQDLSGNNNDFVQTNSSNQPEYYTAVPELDGQAAIRFDGTDEWLPSSFTIPTDGHIFAVVHTLNNKDHNHHFSLTSSDSYWEIWTKSDGTIRCRDGSPTSSYVLPESPVEDRTVFSEMSWSVGGNTRCYLNGKLFESDIADTSNAGNMQLGADSGGDVLDGYISEIMVFNRELSDAERTIIERYFTEKWVNKYCKS